METRKELKQKYSEMKPQMGVYQIKNNLNNKIYLASSINITAKWNATKLQLGMGNFKITQLQKDWNEIGESNFAFEILEDLQEKEGVDTKKALMTLEKKWTEKLKQNGANVY